MQEVLLIILFIGAIAYVANHVYSQYKAKGTGCSKGCGCDKDDTKKSVLIFKPK